MLTIMKKAIRSKLARTAINYGSKNPSNLQLLLEPIHLKRIFEKYEVDCVFDVGANSGQYARMLREKVGYRGSIISFEPIPALSEALRMQARYDPLWEIYTIALSKSDGEASFNIMSDNQFSSLQPPMSNLDDRFKNSNSVTDRITVALSRLDSLFNNLRDEKLFSRPYLKIDTQGHDLSVISGAKTCLSQFIGVQSELSIVSLYEAAPRFDLVINEMERLGFGLSGFVPNNAGHFPRLIEMDGIFLRSDLM